MARVEASPFTLPLWGLAKLRQRSVGFLLGSFILGQPTSRRNPMTDQSGEPVAPKESGGGPVAPYWAPRDVQADSMPRQWRSGREFALRCTAEVPGVTTTGPIQAIPRGTIAMQMRFIRGSNSLE
jgi:hypothetical protein